MSDTICHLLLKTKDRNPALEAARYVNSGKWESINWPEYYKRVESIGAALKAKGVGRGDKVAIYSNTRLEWALTDMAIMGIGAVAVPLYQSLLEEDVEYILNNSESVAVFLEDETLLERFKSISKNCPQIKHIFHYNAVSSNDPELTSFANLLKEGEAALESNPTTFSDEAQKTQLDDLATIVYTSGTTGAPKGVMLCHRQLMSEAEDVFKVLSVNENDRSITFLPFAHILARVEHWGGVVVGFCMAYAENVDRLRSNLLDVNPTFMVAVPRIFEKIYGGVIAQAEISKAKHKIFSWAVKVGKKVSQARIEKKTLPVTTLIQYQAAKKLVFDKLKHKLGGRMRFAVCGGAPLSKEIAEFFHAANLLVLEGYGLTETTAAVTLNSPYEYRFGSVGKPLDDVEIKIAADGEILVKSDKVMPGYYKRDDANKEVFIDGWFATGDIGEFTRDGFLRITDRKKDLIKTAGGKYIAPQKLENSLKLNKYVSNVLIHGDKRKYVVALVTLNSEEAERFATESGVNYKNMQELAQSPQIQQVMREGVASVNSELASFETIKNFAVLDKDFTIEDGELTPSLKVKRKYCDEKYKDILDSLYR